MDLGSAETFETLHSAPFKRDLHGGMKKTSLWYRSFEQLFYPEDVTELVDVWSLGCVLYELYAGQALFEELDDRESFIYNTDVIEDGLRTAHQCLYSDIESVKQFGIVMKECLSISDRITSAQLWENLVHSSSSL